MNSVIKLTVKDVSINGFCQNLDLLREKVRMAGKEAIAESSKQIFDEAYKTCPTFTGTLRDSMYKEQETSGDEIKAVVGHGGRYDKINPVSGTNADSYAVEAHESYKIRKVNRVRGATRKWLEKAVNNEAQVYEERIRQKIKSILGS